MLTALLMASAPAWAETAAMLPASASASATATAPVSATASAPAPSGGQADELARFLRQADDWMLAGRLAPPELPALLQPLAPADRLTALAYLRRGGLYDGPALDLATLLTPAQGTAP